MDADLANQKYWNSYIQDIDTSFGYIESYKNILACDKSNSTLTLYTKDMNKSFVNIKGYSAFTGEAKGDKVREGDLKTPIGIYKLVKKLSKVDSFYGPMAFVTSYPNSYDKYRGHNGSGIWIHGLPLAQERDSYTKGCIAINNQSIECLDRHMNIEETILIISEETQQKNISKESLSNILAQLYAWRYAWLYNDITAYLDFYDDSFLRFDGMNLNNFTQYKTRVFNKNETKTILFNGINVIPYPGTNDMYKVTFSEIYKSSSFSFTGNKVLILKLQDSKIKIITEK
ncbi:putative periplasmic protein [hydrothermal vent metagenome]|uniref:Putative periplasmic protein n=1 Tax=hydrothermal vent metagenome TaxID=652676 RepID=A0A1W1CDF3_9ZZZZ